MSDFEKLKNTLKSKLSEAKTSQEIDIVKSTTGANPEKLNSVVSQTELIEYQELIRKIPVADNVI